MATAFITHADCVKHDMGSHHPESPARVKSVDEYVKAAGLLGKLDLYDAPLATDEQLARAHPESYIEMIRESAPATGLVQLDPDTAMNPYSLNAALRAAGSGVLGIDLVMDGRAQNVFCNVRPCGHHATHNRSMGFCIFNNIAVAAFYATEVHKLDRVAIVDFDVHHGNGTEDIVSDEDRILMCGTFQHPFYPYSGTEDVARNMCNVPLPAGTGSEGFRKASEQIWLPALEKFEPELILVSAGFDAHEDDPLAQLRLKDDDYAWVTHRLIDVAARHSQGRIVSVLEGGYSLQALGRSVVRHVSVLAGLE
jgi:acetoin utilization deacetylase AcuC-like enzyme